MTNDQSPLNQIEQAKALLSPYLDGEVTDAERELVQAALAKSPALQTDLESLQQTVALLGKMSRAPAPRPFTLTQADVGRAVAAPKKRRGWLWLTPLAGAAAALAAVFVVGVLALLNTGSNKEAPQLALAPAVPEMAQEAKMEAPSPTLEMQRAAPVEAAEAPTKLPEQPVSKSANFEKAVEPETTGETFAAAPAPARKSAEEVPSAAEEVAESSAAMKESAPEAEEAGAAAITAAVAMEEAAPVALDAAPADAVNSAADTTGGAAGDMAEEPALSPDATQISEAAEADAALLTLPQTTTLFAPLTAQESTLSGKAVSSSPLPSPVSAEVSPETRVKQAQTGTMALAVGLAVMGLILVFVVAIFLIVKRK